MTSRAQSFAQSPMPRMAVLLMTCVAWGCGGSVSPDINADKLDGGGDGSVIDTGLRPRDSGVDGRVDSGRDTGIARPDTFVDPGCPDAPKPPPLFSCDPYEVPSRSCPRGEGCYPFVLPSEGACDPETYAADCFPAGTGKQGTPCSGEPCAPGFLCVVSGAGNQCGAICHVGTPGSCDDGLVCSPVDVPGIGVCL